MMTGDTIGKAVAAAVVGGLVTWTAAALTLTGRVTAIEQTLLRIETRMDNSQAQQARAKRQEREP